MCNFLFSFKGRISRAKMWLYYILLSLALSVPLGLEVWLDKTEGLGAELRWPTTLIGMGARLAIVASGILVFYLMLAAIVKRFHDRGKSAAWLLLFFGIPLAFFAAAFLIGWPPREAFPGATIAMPVFFMIVMVIIFWYLLELLFLRGKKGDNRFGPDPLAGKGH